ncbi:MULTISPECIES: rhomboid family intramembrane serine protease [Streptomyces phaeochromogenes group]|uniref:Rhomboid family intramembrane serine protease n=1 Tax=Streptomyces phaeochromogenes TaxID=1923 RepID=A0ABZ1H9T9_STRPH|nr:rhomboid family intramembrane serine protease [Streptomyces phaeochromogenes]MCX5601824.1 rhomboid family intramembrane serine protease [Streptomyces phaeochromogenes]WSD15344.1 rhomboid family intramembrane serine protease [Streptomyces phaeochromogenes]
MAYGPYGVAVPAPASRGERVKNAALLVGGWVALLWVLEAIDVATGHALDTFGITPREFGELRDIVPAAFVHFGWDHLAANSVPLLLLGFLAALSGIRRFLAVVTVTILVSGLGVWLTASEHSITAGASGVVFGLFGYLLVRGFVDRRIGDVVIGLVVGAVYGSILWGVLPTTAGVSWQGHLFGLIGGVASAFVFRRPREARA